MSILHEAFIDVKNIKYKLLSHKIPKRHMIKNVPYFSQWETRELAQKIIEGNISAKNDPKWSDSGAKTKEEYEIWSWNGCGMACLKMVLAYKTTRIIPLVTLGKQCTEYGGYKMPLNKSAGMLYKPFVEFAKNEYGLRSKAIKSLTYHEIISSIANNDFVVASVSPQIRNITNIPICKGGHLILIFGYDLQKQQLYFHNPSGFTKQTQEYAKISFDDFKKFFACRGIIIYKG